MSDCQRVCRGVRGATTADANTSEEILKTTRQLLALMIRQNGIDPEGRRQRDLHGHPRPRRRVSRPGRAAVGVAQCRVDVRLRIERAGLAGPVRPRSACTGTPKRPPTRSFTSTSRTPPSSGPIWPSFRRSTGTSWSIGSRTTSTSRPGPAAFGSAGPRREGDSPPRTASREKPMSDPFDPYYQWLGIPPEEQPPDHYRLLGVKGFEDDREVIRTAADRQTVHLQTFQIGERSQLARKLINEVAAARLCLLTPAKKLAYDRRLRERQAASPREHRASGRRRRGGRRVGRDPCPGRSRRSWPSRACWPRCPAVNGSAAPGSSRSRRPPAPSSRSCCWSWRWS